MVGTRRTQSYFNDENIAASGMKLGSRETAVLGQDDRRGYQVVGRIWVVRVATCQLSEVQNLISMQTAIAFAEAEYRAVRIHSIGKEARRCHKRLCSGSSLVVF